MTEDTENHDFCAGSIRKPVKDIFRILNTIAGTLRILPYGYHHTLFVSFGDFHVVVVEVHRSIVKGVIIVGEGQIVFDIKIPISSGYGIGISFAKGSFDIPSW
jgi:hypothetical protein